ncbi:MAG: DUF2141 domain-containing protein, partial [Chitinivibrionales bacterium]|nr:DUF2141 domain-containing protein [Chitinivibrionales bacterium]
MAGRICAMLAAAPLLLLPVLTGCNGNDVAGPMETGSITLTVNYVGYVSDSTPIIVEVKEGRFGEPVAQAVVTRNEESITIDGIPSGEYVVALWRDENNNREFDEFTEPIVFYKVGQVDHAVGAFGDPSEISL